MVIPNPIEMTLRLAMPLTEAGTLKSGQEVCKVSQGQTVRNINERAPL